MSYEKNRARMLETIKALECNPVGELYPAACLTFFVERSRLNGAINALITKRSPLGFLVIRCAFGAWSISFEDADNGEYHYPLDSVALIEYLELYAD